MRHLVSSIMTLWLALAGAAVAEERVVVVELFTSQGCSSCPPADALLAELGDREDVIPLALHIDYWDYIGWKDAFAQPAFTERQKGYARALGNRSIYTPQIIVNGANDVVGNRAMEVAELMQDHAARPAPVTLGITRRGGRLAIRAEARGNAGPAELHLIRYEPRQVVEITRGENAGKRLPYTHIVTDWTTLARWDGRGVFEAEVEIGGDRPVVVLVQAPRHGPILAAARLR